MPCTVRCTAQCSSQPTLRTTQVLLATVWAGGAMPCLAPLGLGEGTAGGDGVLRHKIGAARKVETGRYMNTLLAAATSSSRRLLLAREIYLIIPCDCYPHVTKIQIPISSPSHTPSPTEIPDPTTYNVQTSFKKLHNQRSHAAELLLANSPSTRHEMVRLLISDSVLTPQPGTHSPSSRLPRILG